MMLIALLVMAAQTLPLIVADPDAMPSANARTTSHGSQDLLYSYAYAVDAHEYGNFYDHEEDRTGEVTQGRFRVALPDNRLQTVVYQAGRKGYSAQISYDLHPNFESLRAAVTPVGPIREGPQIGQPVVPGQRTENWKNRENHSVHENNNNIEPQPIHNRRQPTPSPFRPRPRPTPTQQRFSSSSAHSSRAPTSLERPQRSGPNSQQTLKETPPMRGGPRAPMHSGPSAQTLTIGQPHVTRRKTTRPQPTQRFPDQMSIFTSVEGLEDADILNRLIEAIRLKVAEEEGELGATGHHSDDDEDDSHDKKDKPRYTIKNKAGVRARLRAIVHNISLAKI